MSRRALIQKDRFKAPDGTDLTVMVIPTSAAYLFFDFTFRLMNPHVQIRDQCDDVRYAMEEAGFEDRGPAYRDQVFTDTNLRDWKPGR